MKIRKWIWLVMWILSLVGISFYGGAVSYGFFFAMTLLPVISFIYLLCVYLRFKIYQEVESRDMICGQAMPYYFVLRNEDYFGFAGVKVRMFPNFSFVEGVAEDVEYELLPGDEFIYHTTIVCKYRGEYEVGVKEVIVTDFFGIFRLRYKVLGTIKAIVHPKLVELTSLSEEIQMAAAPQREAYGEQSEPDVLVREYVSGDSLKRIHWKSTARQQRLMTRQYTGEEKQGITLLFDTKRYSKREDIYIPLESKILETTLALNLFFAKKQQRITTYWTQNGIRKCDIESMSSFQDFHAKAEAVIFDKDEDSLRLFKELCESGSLYASKMVIGIFHEINDEVVYLAEQLAIAGITVLVYVVTDEDIESFVRQSTARKHIIAIPAEAELGGIL
ncbi:MAG: DUF58 domain-containing protein [Lachnospiraceae bacterium]|nr:DUF58 domain-containing protein [Lachnospiraceae bacterium]